MISAVVAIFLVTTLQLDPPDTLTLEQARERVDNHYPLAQKLELHKEIANLNTRIANTGNYPQLNFNASATYQSEVPEIDVPAVGQFEGPELSKDQYNTQVELTQSIYNGGAVGIQKELEQVKGEQEQLTTKVELHRVKEQLNQTFFGILLAQQQLEIVRSLLESLRDQLEVIESQVENGVLLPRQQHILEAEIINARQDSAEVLSNIRSGFDVLSQLMGEEVSPQTELRLPEVQSTTVNYEVQQRPEIALFEQNRQAMDFRKELVQTSRFPSLSAFGTAAYGRPGYNVFENEFHPYYMVGLRLRWNFWDARNTRHRQQVYQLQQKSINEEEHAFNRQLKAALSKTEEQITTLEEQLGMDREMVQLREKVVEETSSQMENGAATATEYVTELQKETQARLSMQLHQIQLEQAKVNYLSTLGENIN